MRRVQANPGIDFQPSDRRDVNPQLGAAAGAAKAMGADLPAVANELDDGHDAVGRDRARFDQGADRSDEREGDCQCSRL